MTKFQIGDAIRVTATPEQLKDGDPDVSVSASTRGKIGWVAQAPDKVSHFYKMFPHLLFVRFADGDHNGSDGGWWLAPMHITKLEDEDV